MYVEHLKKIGEGVFINPDAGEINTLEIEKHYTEDAIQILKNDQGHYRSLKTELVKRNSPLLRMNFLSADDIAGGHPKLSTLLNIQNVTVFDEFAYMYCGLHDEFISRYPNNALIKYQARDILETRYMANLAICSHILEHLTIHQINDLLDNIYCPYLLVYGPNVEKATSRGWFHFRPSDHRTFLTRAAMETLFTRWNWDIVESFAFHDDYLVFGYNPAMEKVDRNVFSKYMEKE